MVKLNVKKLFTTARLEEVTEEIVYKAIKQHKTIVPKYLDNERLYLSNHDILRADKKEPWKPDNRLVLNYAKYIVDTFSGYHLGVPLKVSHDDEIVDSFIRNFRNLNDAEDSEFELAKIVDIFGHGFIYLYQDEDGNTRMTYNNPINMLMVHDDTVQERPYFAVRYVYEQDKLEGWGEVITDDDIIPFELNIDSVRFKEPTKHIYSKLPVVEMVLNEERQGIFDSVKTLINALNKAVSEKANDVDYFADAYLKVIGLELEEDVAKNIRETRVINLWGETGTPLDASFLDKPNSDTTQQNLIELLKSSIFSISMVADMTEQDFGNASGTALAFKLQAMSNLALAKDRKMQSALNRMYEVVMSVPKVGVPPDAWRGITYQFSRNVPRNLLEEAQVVAQLDGQVSDETKLKVLSIVDNVADELQRVSNEEEVRSKRLLPTSDVDNEVVADVE